MSPLRRKSPIHSHIGNFRLGRIPSLQWGVRERQDSARKQTYANLADSSHRLGDLGHFERWREAFERRREDGVSLREAVGRLVELGERERPTQLETARSLLLRDRDRR